MKKKMSATDMISALRIKNGSNGLSNLVADVPELPLIFYFKTLTFPWLFYHFPEFSTASKLPLPNSYPQPPNLLRQHFYFLNY